MSQWQNILELAELQADFELIDAKKDKRQLRVTLVLKRRLREGRCSRCNTLSQEIHSTDRVRLRDLPSFGYEVFLDVERFTVNCSNCDGNFVEDFWLWRKRRDFTWRYECHISRMCEEMTNKAVSRLERVNDKTVFNIDYELLKIRLHYQKPPEIGPHYSMDEVHFRSHKTRYNEKKPIFITNLMCLKNKRVISNAMGRDEKAAKTCFLLLSKEEREKALSCATDLHSPFHSAIKECLPNADIILDVFHIKKLFNEAVDSFRQAQLKLAYDSDEIQLLKGKHKYLLTTHDYKLSKHKRGLLNELKALNERVIEALLIRDHFTDFFKSPTLKLAKQRWKKLKKIVFEADIKAFNIFFQRLEKWMDHLWNYFETRTSSAVIEALNHKIKVTRSSAYGYRNIFYYQLKILQRVGFLNSKYAKLPKIQESFR